MSETGLKRERLAGALRNPLNDVTRRMRRTLLTISIIGIAIEKGGFIPTKISALGIEITQSDQNALLSIAAAIVLYFVITFIIYAWTDYLGWYFGTLIRHGRALIEKETEAGIGENLHWNVAKISLAIRLFLEFIFPVLLGLYTFFVLIII